MDLPYKDRVRIVLESLHKTWKSEDVPFDPKGNRMFARGIEIYDKGGEGSGYWDWRLIALFRPNGDIQWLDEDLALNFREIVEEHFRLENKHLFAIIAENEDTGDWSWNQCVRSSYDGPESPRVSDWAVEIEDVY